MSIIDQVKGSPLLRDMAMSAAFGVVGIAAQSSTDPLLSHLSGGAIGFGFGFAIHSLMIYRAKKFAPKAAV